MNTEQIKARLNEIADDNLGIVYTDYGSGSAGPGFVDSNILREMCAAGDFNDVVRVPMDEDLAIGAFSDTGIKFAGTD